jgi:hypothetical protein
LGRSTDFWNSWTEVGLYDTQRGSMVSTRSEYLVVQPVTSME